MNHSLYIKADNDRGARVAARVPLPATRSESLPIDGVPPGGRLAVDDDAAAAASLPLLTGATPAGRQSEPRHSGQSPPRTSPSVLVRQTCCTVLSVEPVPSCNIYLTDRSSTVGSAVPAFVPAPTPSRPIVPAKTQGFDCFINMTYLDPPLARRP